MNEEAHDAAQGMIGEIFVLKADRPLYCGREILAHEEEFLLTGVVPKDIEKPKKYGFLRRAYKYKLIGDILYMLGVDLVLRRVPWKEELYEVLEENHDGGCGGYFALKITLHKILQEGYVWPSLHKDVYHWCKSCKRCQSFGKRVLKPELRKSILAYDVFEKWGIVAVGPLPITSRGKNYILIAVDYLSRWAEAKAVRQITAKDVAKFVYEEICCKFGMPLELLLDQGPRFRADLLGFLCKKMNITRRFTTPYYPQCNGLNERSHARQKKGESPILAPLFGEDDSSQIAIQKVTFWGDHLLKTKIVTVIVIEIESVIEIEIESGIEIMHAHADDLLGGGRVVELRQEVLYRL
ncbi:hypothetical protein L7F22_040200 [Adiantum nelumboides]|nr:hypothetical protein [Adiantum nelumboides]